MFKDSVIAIFDKIWHARNWFIFFTFYLNRFSSLQKLVYIALQFYKNPLIICVYIYIYSICVYLKNVLNYIMMHESVFR